MLHIDLNGTRLQLRPGTSLNMELVNPLLADGIEDSHSLPIEVPVAGNEIALGQVHEIALRRRQLSLPGAVVGYDGVPIHTGTLSILSSDAGTVRGTISAEAFVALMGETMLRTTLEPLVIDMLDGSGSIASHVTAQNALVAAMPPGSIDSGWTHYFPLYSNPQLYGTDNPSWFRSASEFDASKAYAVDELITFNPAGPVRRARRYQCISPTSAGQDPASTPTKWKELADGLVNVIDHITGEPKQNSVAGNYYALVPWWRLRHLVIEVLKFFELDAGGDAFLQGGPLGPESMYVVGNNVPLDAEVRTNYFRASQVGEMSFPEGSAWQQFRIPGQNDSTDGNEDVNDVWDPDTSTFTAPVEGTYQFILRFRVTFPTTSTLVVVARLSDGTGFDNGRPPRTRGVVHQVNNVSGSYETTIEFTLTFSAAQVGVPIFFAVFGSAGNGVVWPAISAHSYEGCVIQGWKTATDGVNTYRTTIRTSDHVPDWTAAEFLDRVADVFGLEVVPNMERRVVMFNRRIALLDDMHRHTSPAPDRLLANPELDHSRATKGVTMRWNVELGEAPDLTRLRRLPDVLFEDEVEAPTAMQQVVLVRSTRKLFVSVYRPGSGIVWEHRGYHLDDALVGERIGARQIPVEFVPVHMDEVRLDDDAFVVPLASEAGDCSFYGGRRNEGKAWLAIANGYSLGAEGRAYVTASSWGRHYGGARQPLSLLLQAEESDDDAPADHWTTHHLRWWRMITAAEAVTSDLLVDHAFLRGRARDRFLAMANQTYLCERLPVVYASGTRTLVSKGAYLLRIREETAEVDAFVCVGPGCIAVTIGESMQLYYPSGYVSYRRRSDKTVTTVPMDWMMETITGPDTLCIWPSDEDGVPVTGDREGLIMLGDTSDIDLSQLAGINFLEGSMLQIEETLDPTITIPAINGLGILYLVGPNLRSVPLPADHELVEIVVAGVLTSAAVNAILANLRAVREGGFDGLATVDLSLGLNAAPTGQGLTDKAWLIGDGVDVTTN